MAIVPYVILLGLVGWYLFSRSLLLENRRDYVSLYGEMYVPLFLFFAYGVAGFSLLFTGSELRFSHSGVYFTNWDIFFGFLAISGAMLCIPFGFMLVYRPKSRRIYNESDIRSQRALNLFMALVIFCDVYARISMIYEGSYFSWMRAGLVEGGSLVGGGIVTNLQRTVEPLIGAFFAYKSVSSKSWRLASGVFLFLVLLKGQRAALFEVGIAYIFTSLYFSKARGPHFRIVKYSVAFVALAFFFSSVIVDVRAHYRSNMGAAKADPVGFIYSTTVTTIPQSVFGGSPESSQLRGSQTLMSRMTHWQGAFSSEISRLRSGSEFMPFRHFLESLSLPIPSVLYPGEKPIVEQGQRTSRWFNLGANRHGQKFDPGTTVFTDIHKYGGFPMMMVLGLMIGCANGFIARYAISRYRAFGVVVFFGMVGSIKIMANDYAAFFVGLRSVLIILMMVALAHYLSRIKISN